MATDKRVFRKLNHLYQICRAGEKGFATVAANVKNRGLKVALKTYAAQRAQFADEIKEEILRLGGSVGGEASLPAMVHRGRMDFYATFMTGEQNVENVVLGEARLGENVAQDAYQRVLSIPLPPETRALVNRQYQQVLMTRDEVNLLRGQAGKRLIIRLFDSEQDMTAALKALEAAGIRPEKVEPVELKQIANIYTGRGSTAEDVLLAGAVGGAIWGGIIGTVAGASAATAPGMPEIAGSSLGTWAVIALSGIVLGALGAMAMGFAISTGIAEEDSFVYEASLKHGGKLARLTVDSARAEQAAEIMHQINSAARARPVEGTPQAMAGQ
jgi:uncharacterized protein (TIGR02284 family)